MIFSPGISRRLQLSLNGTRMIPVATYVHTYDTIYNIRLQFFCKKNEKRKEKGKKGKQKEKRRKGNEKKRKKNDKIKIKKKERKKYIFTCYGVYNLFPVRFAFLIESYVLMITTRIDRIFLLRSSFSLFHFSFFFFSIFPHFFHFFHSSHFITPPRPAPQTYTGSFSTYISNKHCSDVSIGTMLELPSCKCK